MVDLVQFIIENRLSITERTVRDEMYTANPESIEAVEQTRRPSSAISGLSDEVRHLPMAPTRVNKELVRTRKYFSDSAMLPSGLGTYPWGQAKFLTTQRVN